MKNLVKASNPKRTLYWLPGILILILLSTIGSSRAAGQGGYIYDVREIETGEELGVASPAGLAYTPQAGVFELLDSSANAADNPRVAEMNMYGRLAGQAAIVDKFSSPLNIAFNPRSNSLFHLNTNANTLDQIPVDASGKLPASASVSSRFDIQAYGLSQAEGMTFNPADGTLFLLDPAGKRMIRVVPDANGSYDSKSANKEGRIQRIDLKGLGASHLRGIAFNPSNSHLFVLGSSEKTLYEITEGGALVNTFDLSTFTLADPGGMVFAPSGDNTDDPAIQDLFIADSGQVQGGTSGTGQVLELSLTQPVLQAALPSPSTDISRVQVIDTSKWSIPSPDPAGIDFRASTGKLMISDSEVDEMSIWQGKNVFESTLAGDGIGICNVLSFSKEPAGLAVNPANDHIFISDDGKALIFDIGLGPDNTCGTADDTRVTINSLAFNDGDPEALAFVGNKLVASDGTGSEVYVIDPGPNQTYGNSDDLVTHFDTASLGVRDPEGIGYYDPGNTGQGTLIIAARKELVLLETTLEGTPLNVYDISGFSGVVHPSGVGIGPGSLDSSTTSIYVTDRGVDNNQNPNENDGKIHEFVLGNTPPPPPPPPPGPASLYLSFADGNSYTVGTVSGVRDEDILSFDGVNYSMFFDGSDVGVGGVDVDAFAVTGPNTILMSFDNPVTLPNVGAVADTDIVQFDATSLGDNTAGTFSMYFNGADVGLDTAAEDIDGLGLLPDGRILISTFDTVSILGISAVDEDILAFTPTSLGSTTNGTWSMYFDGSDVGLADNSGEDVDGLDVGSDGNIYLSTRSLFSVPGISGDNEDVFVCTPTSLGDTTACSYSPTLFFDGSVYGVAALNVDGIDLP